MSCPRFQFYVDCLKNTKYTKYPLTLNFAVCSREFPFALQLLSLKINVCDTYLYQK